MTLPIQVPSVERIKSSGRSDNETTYILPSDFGDCMVLWCSPDCKDNCDTACEMTSAPEHLATCRSECEMDCCTFICS